MDFKMFDGTQYPATGKAWARLYAAAARTIHKDEPLCVGVFQTKDKSSVCASSVVALGLAPFEFFEKHCRVIDKYELIDGTEYIFSLIPRKIKDAIEFFIKSKFSKKQISEMTSCDDIDCCNEKEIADSLVDFIATQNDSFTENVYAMKKFGITKKDQDELEDNKEMKLSKYHPLRMKLERARGNYMKYILTECAKYAAARAA